MYALLCGCIRVVCNGHRQDGTQRYVCKDCGKSFVIATHSISCRNKWIAQSRYTDAVDEVMIQFQKQATAAGRNP